MINLFGTMLLVGMMKRLVRNVGGVDDIDDALKKASSVDDIMKRTGLDESQVDDLMKKTGLSPDELSELLKTKNVDDIIKNVSGIDDVPEVSYDRTSGFRKGVRDDVWESAKNADGDVIGPLTKQVMNPNEPWDMGHKPGHEFTKHQQSAIERGISRAQFLDEHNIASHYRPELPSTNRSRILEEITDLYFGP